MQVCNKNELLDIFTCFNNVLYIYIHNFIYEEDLVYEQDRRQLQLTVRAACSYT
jgi:hypothetical protein